MLEKAKECSYDTYIKNKNFKTFKVIRSFAKFTCRRLRPCVNSQKCLKQLILVEAT